MFKRTREQWRKIWHARNDKGEPKRRKLWRGKKKHKEKPAKKPEDTPENTGPKPSGTRKQIIKR